MNSLRNQPGFLKETRPAEFISAKRNSRTPLKVIRYRASSVNSIRNDAYQAE